MPFLPRFKSLGLSGIVIRSYREFLREEEEEEEINAAIRPATSTGRPLGGEGFIRKLEKRLNRDLFPKKGGWPKGKRKK